jgi:hypothetical protein
MFKAALAGLLFVFAGLMCLVPFGVAAGIGYLIWHFIAKYW